MNSVDNEAAAPVIDPPLRSRSIVCGRCAAVLADGDASEAPLLQDGCPTCITLSDQEAGVWKRIRAGR